MPIIEFVKRPDVTRGIQFLGTESSINEIAEIFGTENIMLGNNRKTLILLRTRERKELRLSAGDYLIAGPGGSFDGNTYVRSQFNVNRELMPVRAGADINVYQRLESLEDKVDAL
jgi:hypothetical protein